MSTESLRVACSNCNLRELCLPVGLSANELTELDALVSNRRRIKKGTPLYTEGAEFQSLFAIRSGFFKTRVTTPDGRDQVTGFQMTGEILGLDGIVNEKHSCDAIALEDSEVCVMPFSRIEEISRSVRSLQNHMHKIMSREIVKDQSIMMLLGGMRAEERLAAFLMNLIQRLSARGFSKTELILRMTREEIGNYLGMKLETVSRTFSKFADEGLIEVHQKHLLIKKPDELKKIAVPSPDNCS